MPDIELEDALDESFGVTTQPEASPTVVLIKEGNDITNQIVEAKDQESIEDLTNQFKLNMRKKNIARANKLSGMLELIDDEVFQRLGSYPESFDNDQLVKYMDSTQRTLNTIQQTIDQQPMIQINNQKNEININNNVSGLDRESRLKVLEAVDTILNSLQQENDPDIIDINPEEDHNEEGL